MTKPLPRRPPGETVQRRDTDESGSDVFGQPSPCLVARSESGLARFLQRQPDDTDQTEEGHRVRTALPSWLHEGARVFDPAQDCEAIVQFIGEWQDPKTRRVLPCAVFLRPEGGGVEWIVAPEILRPAALR